MNKHLSLKNPLGLSQQALQPWVVYYMLSLFTFCWCVSGNATDWRLDSDVWQKGFHKLQLDEGSQTGRYCWVNGGELLAWGYHDEGHNELKVIELSTKTVMSLPLVGKIMALDGHPEESKVLCVLVDEAPTVLEAYEEGGSLVRRDLDGFHGSPMTVKYSSDGEKVAYTARTTTFGLSEVGIHVHDTVSGHNCAVTTKDFFNQHPVWLPDGSGLIYEKTFEHKSFFGFRTSFHTAIMLALAPWDSKTEAKIAYSRLHSIYYHPYDNGNSILYVVFRKNSRDSAELWEYIRSANTNKRVFSLGSLFGVGWDVCCFSFSDTGNRVVFGISSEEQAKAGLWRLDIAKRQVERIFTGSFVRCPSISPCGHSVAFENGKKFIVISDLPII